MTPLIIVSTKFCVAFVPTPLLAVITSVSVAALLAVPLSTPLVRLRPLGIEDDVLNVGAG